MAETFKRYLCVSSTTSELRGDTFHLRRLSWRDLSKLGNASDYDGMVLNLSELNQCTMAQRFKWDEIDGLFNANSWADVIAAGGRICLIGYPTCVVPLDDNDEDLPFDVTAGRRIPSHVKPLDPIISVQLDIRELEYRRVKKNNYANWGDLYAYLDLVCDWSYSISNIEVGPALASALRAKGNDVRANMKLGTTTFQTDLAVVFRFELGPQPTGMLALLPSTGRSTEQDDDFILRTFLGVITGQQEPAWVTKLKLPNQEYLERRVAEKLSVISETEKELATERHNLNHYKRWFRLLYDDGDGLETMVKEAMEFLGAGVAKKSKEKDDFRLNVTGQIEGVIEVKGTHNPKFKVGVLRQLTGWVDEVDANEQIPVKGIFVGNASRSAEPQTRDSLFEPNSEKYAQTKGFVILRSMDLFCLVLLKQVSTLDLDEMWKRIYACQGSFDANDYWQRLAPVFGMGKTST